MSSVFTLFLCFQRYNPHTDEWALVASLPISRSGFGTAVMDNVLYLFGGCNNLSKVCFTTCVGNQGTILSSFPHFRGIQAYTNQVSKCMLNVSRTFVYRSSYCSDCLCISNICPLQVNTVDCYDPEKDKWTFLVTPMSTRRSGLGVGVAPTFLF